MFETVAYIRALCAQRNIPVSRLERDCGFSNGYLNPRKLKKLPYDRALRVAEYLSVPVSLLLTGAEPDVLDEVDIAFYGDFKALNEEQKETVRDMVRVMRQRRASAESNRE